MLDRVIFTSVVLCSATLFSQSMEFGSALIIRVHDTVLDLLKGTYGRDSYKPKRAVVLSRALLFAVVLFVQDVFESYFRARDATVFPIVTKLIFHWVHSECK